VIEQYLARLGADLARRGVRCPANARVVDEARDHLLELAAEHGEEGAIERFGSSEELARDVAAQLATTRTIRSTYGAFAALAFTGVVYLAFMALAGGAGGGPDLFSARHEAVGVAAVIGLVLFPQIAFVAGCLALLRALRRRGTATVSSDELGVIRARAAVAVGAGAMTVVSMAVWIAEFRQSAWLLALPALAVIPLVAVAVSVGRAGRPQAAAGGSAGDVFDDLGFRMEPWRFAMLFAAFIAFLGFAGGWVVEGDPGSGIVRGGFEGVAVLACFVVLGRRLALRR
jgi:HAAS domain-containing protein